jgi:hypothetical protein
MRIAASLLNDIGPVWTGGRWVHEIDMWRPEVIHSLLGGVRITRLVVALARRFDVPVVPHFMDDWMGTLYADGQLLGLARREVDRLVAAVLAQSPLCITIGRDMQAEYERTLRLDSRVVGNSVDFEAFDRLERAPRSSGGVKTMSYVGGLHLGRARALRDVGRTLEKDNSSGGTQWILRIMVPAADLADARLLAEQVPAIEVGGTLPPSEVPATLVSSDALLFVESSDPSIARFTRLSVSTKVPEYLAARRRVLVVGPSDQASVRSLVRSGVARYAGDGGDPSEMEDAWKGLKAKIDAEPEVAAVSPTTVEEYGTRPTQERLRQALMDAVGRA